MFQIKLGITTLFFTFLPANYIAIFLLGGMYRPKFEFISPAIYASLSLIIPLLFSFIATILFIKLTNLEDRLPTNKPAKTLLLISSLAILLLPAIKVISYMVYTGGITTGLITLLGPFVLIAKIALYIGIAQLLMAVEPHKSYVFSTYTPFSEVSKNKI